MVITTLRGHIFLERKVIPSIFDPDSTSLDLTYLLARSFFLGKTHIHTYAHKQTESVFGVKMEKYYSMIYLSPTSWENESKMKIEQSIISSFKVHLSPFYSYYNLKFRFKVTALVIMTHNVMQSIIYYI